MERSKTTTIVTGAGSGIGREIAHRLLEDGNDVVLVGRTEATLVETARKAPERAMALPTDIGSADACSEVVRRTIERFGRVDTLVNNAGVAPLEKIHETSEETVTNCLAINLAGPMHLIIACWPHFMSQRSGCIVNISSVASIDPFPGFLAYAASKSGVDSLTRSIIAEGAIFGIRGFTVNPGAVETPMLRSNFNTTFLPEEHVLPPEAIANFVVECIKGEHDEKQGRQNPLSKT